MIIEGLRNFNVPDKPIFAAWPCPIDISRFLNGDSVASVQWVANKSDGSNATDDVLDDLKHTYSATEIIPWIEAGDPGATYIATGRVITSSGVQEIFYLRWSVIPSQPPILNGVGLDAVLN